MGLFRRKKTDPTVQFFMDLAEHGPDVANERHQPAVALITRLVDMGLESESDRVMPGLVVAAQEGRIEEYQVWAQAQLARLDKGLPVEWNQRGQDAPPEPPPAGDGQRQPAESAPQPVPERIQLMIQLKRLHLAGVLDDEEYQEKLSKITSSDL